MRRATQLGIAFTSLSVSLWGLRGTLAAWTHDMLWPAPRNALAIHLNCSKIRPK
jgi:hypothetical protein